MNLGENCCSFYEETGTKKKEGLGRAWGEGGARIET